MSRGAFQFGILLANSFGHIPDAGCLADGSGAALPTDERTLRCVSLRSRPLIDAAVVTAGMVILRKEYKMSHKIFNLLFGLVLIIGLVVMPASQPARAAGPWYVALTGNDANDCLSPATTCATINGALNKPGFVAGDTILVAIGTYTGTGSDVVLLNKSAILSGGWDETFTTQSGMSTIDGQAARRGITVNGGVTTTLERFVVQNSGNNSINGGGIYSQGTLTLNNSIIIGNTSGFNGGGGGGGGISNVGTVTVNNSTISGNFGGGISNWGTVTLNNSTVNGNTASIEGGGIGDYNGGMLTLNNSTISGNTASSGGGIFAIQGGTIRLNNSTVSLNTASRGGGIYNSAAVVIMQNTLLAGNTASSTSPDCNGSIGSSGYNLIGDASNCDFTATTGDMTDLDPFLGPLQDNGGPTFTHALLPQSPAINAGNITGCSDQDGNPLASDQRGITRPQGIACDIGAYEYIFTTPGPATSLAIMSGSGQSSTLNLAFAKPLRVVALDSQGNRVSGVTVTFTAPASGASGTFADTGTNTTTIDTDAGGVATTSIFTANNQVGVYTVSASATGLGSVNFSLRNGDWYVATMGNDSNSCSEPAFPCATINGALNKPDFVAGDIIRVAIGTYTSTGYEVVLLDKDATLSGGWDETFTTQSGMSTIDGQGARRGITVNASATVTVRSFTVQNGFNSDQGAGIFNTGVLTITDSIIKDNITSPSYPYGAGGGIWSGGDGISASGGRLTLNNTSVISNVAATGGGISSGGSMILNSTVVKDNVASGAGGGINAGGEITLNGSAVLNNTAAAGGGLSGYASMTLNNSSVSGNTSTSYIGGGIDSNGDLTLTNSTISGNTAQSYGGGIYHGQGDLTLNNATISANTAGDTGGGIFQGAHTATMRNSLIAGNTATTAPDCFIYVPDVFPFVSAGYNLIGDTSGCDFTPTTGDMTNIDPLLGPLQNNGGPTDTHALLPGSPAIDSGNPAGCTDQNGNLLTTDQRGVARHQGARCDIGAFEAEAPAVVFPKTPVLDDFNRPNGGLGTAWAGARGGYKIVNQQVDVGAGGAVFWKPNIFGADQEAFVTLTKIDPASTCHTLMLKVQNRNNLGQGVILVSYNAVSGTVEVEAWDTQARTWRLVGSFTPPVSVTDGDSLGARALADGTVQAFINGTLVGTADAGSFYAGKGGQIGLWFLNAHDAVFDDFGGGTITP